MRSKRCVVTGAAGFIGSHLTDRLLALGFEVIGIDNLKLGRSRHLAEARANPRFRFLEADLNDASRCLDFLKAEHAAAPIQTFWHLAANSDVRAGSGDNDVDLRDTFLTTYHSLKAARRLGIREFAFASSSAIYGNHPAVLTEETGPLRPISNYGAMKLASEGIITAGLEAFLERAWVFRFPNVVGGRATHGVIHDFLHKLRQTPPQLDVLGDGNQEKPYLHVAELVAAMLFIVEHSRERFNCHNIGPDGTATTVRYIAEAVVNAASPGARIVFGNERQGWPGDVPRFNYSIARLRSLGWAPRLTSDQAVEQAIPEVMRDLA